MILKDVLIRSVHKNELFERKVSKVKLLTNLMNFLKLTFYPHFGETDDEIKTRNYVSSVHKKYCTPEVYKTKMKEYDDEHYRFMKSLDDQVRITMDRDIKNFQMSILLDDSYTPWLEDTRDWF
jgi:hypothetical protein